MSKGCRAWVIGIAAVLLPGCPDKPGVEHSAVASAGSGPSVALTSSSAQAVGSTAPTVVASNAVVEAPTLPPLPIPPDKPSAMPSLADFRKAPTVEIGYATALGCEARMLRDWIMVQCKEGPATDKPVGANAIRTQGNDARVRVSKVGDGVQVTMPLRKGVEAKAEILWRTPGWGKRLVRVVYETTDERPVVTFDAPPPGPEQSPLSLGQLPGEKPHVGRMILVPAGARKGKEPVEAFYLDETEVTFHAWNACVQDGACPPPSGATGCPRSTQGVSPLRPINCITWNEARAYCAWAGKRLPSEQEFWFAYYGSDDRIYPWGNAVEIERICDYQQHEWVEDAGKRRLLNLGCKVGSHPLGKGPFSHEDLLSNVAEWTSDEHDGKKVVLGGAFGSVSGMEWRDYWGWLMKDLRKTMEPDSRQTEIGFRCARDAH